jgi:N-acyl-D-amino-acid deacylase
MMPRRTNRREFIADGARLVLALGSGLPFRLEAATHFDLVLKGGTLLDGTGGPAWQADLGITGDTIEAVGTIAPEQAKRVIDVTGLHVCPGFIDIHTHSDEGILSCPTADSRVRQGITTEVTGNCGSSAAPLRGLGSEEIRKNWLVNEGIDADWSDVASYMSRIERIGISVNHALLLGQGTIRAAEVGEVNRPLSPDELTGVLRAVEEGMDQGAFGLSTGLEYTPGRYTPTAEIVEMARIVSRRGGLYASHIRDEEALLLDGVNEAIDIGRLTGARVEISHLKAAGRQNWGKQRPALDLIESARRQGVEVLADAYPYVAYSTGLSIFLPDWALEGGTRSALERLRDPGSRERIRKEVAVRIAADPGDYDLIVVSRTRNAKNGDLIGMNLAQIGAMWQIKPLDALLRLLDEEEGDVPFIGYGMSPQNVEMVLGNPLVMIGSDGESMAPVGKTAASRPHPRSYGSHARVLAHYTIEKHLLDLPTAVKKMTSMPADQVGISDRGRISRGRKADIVVIDAAGIKDEATFDNPHRYPEGILHVLVNGVPVVQGGSHTGARPGRMLRKA